MAEKLDEEQKQAPVISSDVEETSTSSNGINESALVRKLDLRLLPSITILYLLSFLDRANVANARLEGLTADLHMTGNQYLTGLTLYFIGYVIFEIPSNIVLKRTSPQLWLPSLTLAWGIVATLMGVTQNMAGFFAVRFVLGATEAGLFPGCVYYMSMWYKRRERQYRIALFFSAASLGGAAGGILAYGIAFMNGVGHYRGWRWIFIIEGLVTVVVSVLAYFFIVNYPNTAKFITDDERDAIQARLKADSDATRHEEFNWVNVKSALFDYKPWLYGLAFHTMSLPLYTLSLFLPTIIASLGYKAADAQLMTIPPYAIATVLTVLWAYLSQRTGRRAPFVLASSSLGIVGYIILLSDHKPSVSYGGTILAAAGIYPSVALSLAWPAANVSGQTKRAVACALQITVGNLGAVLGTQLYRPKTSPHYHLGHGFACGYLIANLIVTSIIWFALSRENRRRDAAGNGQWEGGLQNFEHENWEGDADPRWRFST